MKRILQVLVLLGLEAGLGEGASTGIVLQLSGVTIVHGVVVAASPAAPNSWALVRWQPGEEKPARVEHPGFNARLASSPEKHDSSGPPAASVPVDTMVAVASI